MSIVAGTAQAVPMAESFTTPLGLQGMVMTDRSLPMVTIQLTFPRAGSVSDPKDKQGLAHFVATMLKEGAGPYSGQAFRTALEDRAIQLSASAGADQFTVRIKTLSEHLSEAIRLTGIMLDEPTFDLKAIERIRQKLLTNLKQYQEDPGWHAAWKWDQIAYGDHPYSYSSVGTQKTLKDIQQADMIRWMKQALSRENVIISAVGDVDSTKLSLLIDAALKPLPANQALPELAMAPTLPEGAEQAVIVERDIPQTIALFGTPAPMRKDPDFYAAYVMNYILGGGGLTGRLSEAIRQDRGLAYYASSSLSPMMLGSSLIGSFATRNEQAMEAKQVMEEVLKRAADKGFDEKEVVNARDYITGSFPLELDTQSDRVGYLTSMQLYGLGEDYLIKRNSYFDAVTLQDVNRVASKMLTKRPLTVMVGQPGEVQ